MTYRKKLIEVALPLEAINAASAREKSIRHGHPSTLHLWWARRPLAAARAVIFTSLVDDPDDPQAPQEFVQACQNLPKGKNAIANDTPRQRLFDFIERLVTWEATTDEEILEQARELIRLCTDGNPPPLLDPFAGGGSIPLEAQRLGLEAHASDLNPVAVMINKALIEIPSIFEGQSPVNSRDRIGTAGKASWKGASGLAADVRYYGEWMRDRVWENIGYLYPKCHGETVIAWFWARTIECPNPACRARMPLVRSFDLSKKKGRKVWVEPIVNSETKEITFSIRYDSAKQTCNGTIDRRGAKCLACETPVPFDYIRSEGKENRMNVKLMAIVTEGKNGRNYYSPEKYHEEVAFQATPEWEPLYELGGKAALNVSLYGFKTFSDLFTARELTALTNFSDMITEVRERIFSDALDNGMENHKPLLRDGGAGAQAYAEAISVYLAFAIDKAADHWSSIVTWRNSVEAHRSTFSRQAIPMVWDFVEVNPFSSSAGNWLDTCISFLGKFLEDLPLVYKSGVSFQKDARDVASLERKYLISTDPPYYDNIEYADLSDFSYVWMRRTLKNTYPEILSTLLVPKQQEIIASRFRFDDPKEANRYFERGLRESFIKMREISHPQYPLTVYYAFKQTEIIEKDISLTGWETMLTGLIEAGYLISGTWPIRTERGGRMVSIGANALASSILLVCRLRSENAPIISRRDFLITLRKELPIALREMQIGYIAPVDLAQASIGPGMAVYSRYSKVLEPNGERLTVRSALQIINQELDAYLTEQEGYIDRDSRFAVAWFEQYGFKEGPFGQADVLARAKNTSVEGLSNAGVLEAGAGKVSLYHWSELDPGWDPSRDSRLTTWEATHHLIERLNSHGEQGAAQLLAKMPADLAAQARQLAYRLYSICERKGWAENARDYNALVISWSTSQEQASVIREQYQQGRLFQ